MCEANYQNGQIEDVCLEPCKKQTPKNSKFPNAIIYDIDYIVPINTGKKCSLINTFTSLQHVVLVLFSLIAK